MKKTFYLLLVICLSMMLVVNPALARVGNGNGGGNSSSSAAAGSAKIKETGNSIKTDNPAMSKGTENTVKGQIGSSELNNALNNPNNKASKVLEKMNQEQKQAVKSRLAEKKSKVEMKEFIDTSIHWAQNNIAKVQRMGLISGYQDGTFQPDSPVSAVEAMVMAVNLAEMLGTDELIKADANSEAVEGQESSSDEDDEDVTSEPDSEEDNTDDSDVPQWAENKAKAASQLRIVNINRFHSAVQASRAQTAVMLAKALNLEPKETTEFSFSDAILISSEDLGYILALREAGIIFGSPDGKFNPNSAVTRAEIAAMLARAIDDVDEEDSDDIDNADEIDEANTDEGETSTDLIQETPATDENIQKRTSSST